MGRKRICVQVYIYVAFVVAAVITADQDEDKNVICPGPLTYYRDLECIPVYDSERDNCPKRYDCNHLKRRSQDRCYINGYEYEPNQFLDITDANVCDLACMCRESYVRNEIAAFRCLQVPDCIKIKPKRGCYIREDPSKCCNNPIEICPKNINDRAVCIVDGNKYLDGEFFEVNGEPNLNCVCRPGYKGKNVPPFCIKINHSPCLHPAFDHTDYFRQNCAPIFFTHIRTANLINMCYMKMKCQDPNDAVIPVRFPVMMDDNWNNMCLYGNMIMRIGDRLKVTPDKFNTCVYCKCEVPPVLSCHYISEESCAEEKRYNFF